jgi:hypothetical protein
MTVTKQRTMKQENDEIIKRDGEDDPERFCRTEVPTLPLGTRFEVDKRKKYSAFVPVSVGDKDKVLRVPFGGSHQSAQYEDRVPLGQGAGHFKHLNVKGGENGRRTWINWRKRHSRIKTKDGSLARDVKLSPEWFSWHFLW